MNWRDLLKKAVTELGSVAAVSRELCGSDRLRPRLSLALNGKYFGDEAALEKMLRDRFDRRDCPHTGEEITADTCRKKANAPRPFGGAARARHWEACQTCKEKPL